MESGKLELTICILNEREKDNHVSYIRKIKPDYVLEIHGTGVEVKVDECLDILFSHGVDCCLFLNYGDLFLSALNAIESRENIEKYILWLSSGILNCKNSLVNAINNAKHSRNGRVLDSSLIQKLNLEYKRYDEALAFALTAFLAIYEDQREDGFFSYRLTDLLSDPLNFGNYGALSAADFQENLKKHNLFSEISVKIRYRDEGEEYSFSDFASLIGFEIRQMIGKNSEIKICKNCGRFFVPANRCDEKFCANGFDGFKTCKQVAFSRRLDNDEILKTYRKIYKTQNARKQRNKHRLNIASNFDCWSEYAKTKLTQCQKGEIDLETMISDISGNDWMSGDISK